MLAMYVADCGWTGRAETSAFQTSSAGKSAQGIAGRIGGGLSTAHAGTTSAKRTISASIPSRNPAPLVVTSATRTMPCGTARERKKAWTSDRGRCSARLGTPTKKETQMKILATVLVLAA